MREDHLLIIHLFYLFHCTVPYSLRRYYEFLSVLKGTFCSTMHLLITYFIWFIFFEYLLQPIYEWHSFLKLLSTSLRLYWFAFRVKMGELATNPKFISSLYFFILDITQWIWLVTQVIFIMFWSWDTTLITILLRFNRMVLCFRNAFIISMLWFFAWMLLWLILIHLYICFVIYLLHFKML